ncbi:MAG: NERD domain-containing protein [Massilia sp.]|nr:NERD domain-containing protein [Massilia sp.]
MERTLVDPLSLLAGPVLAYWWAILLIALSTLARLTVVKGCIGEAMRHVALRLRLPREHYHLRRNLTLPTSDGSTQVDHVVVSRYGVFVIETKNYGGWIFGKPLDKTWTQKFPHRSSAFQNPLHQNHKHVRTLAELAAIDDAALFSLVVFVGPSTFKTPMPPNVTRLRGCLAYVRARQAPLFDDAEVTRILGRIDDGRLEPSWRTHAAHVEHVRALRAGRERAEAALRQPACPHCGGTLDEYVYKTGVHIGQAFQGCTRFPACRYRVDLPAR